MSHKKWCPRCNQGWVIPVKIRQTGLPIQFCLECEAVWWASVKELKAEHFSERGEEGTFMTLASLFEKQGIPYRANSLENIHVENKNLWQSHS